MQLPRGKPAVYLLIMLVCILAAAPLIFVYGSPLGPLAVIIGSLSGLMAMTHITDPLRRREHPSQADDA